MPSEVEVRGIWPDVGHDDWCGEFQWADDRRPIDNA
jgi:hypothetical protein